MGSNSVTSVKRKKKQHKYTVYTYNLSSYFISVSFGVPSFFCPLFPQPNLYPTVGLQTPGEIVDANFGQHPFVFDIEDYMSEWRAKIHSMIARFPIGERLGEWQTVLQK